MGAHYDKSKKRWIARSKMVNGKRKYLGAFKSEADAENAVAIYELTKLTTSNFAPLHQVETPFELPKKQGFFARLFRRA